MTENELTQANNLIQNIQKYTREIDELTKIRQTASLKDVIINISYLTHVIPVPKAIVNNIIDAVITKYTNQLQKAQTDFAAL